MRGVDVLFDVDLALLLFQFVLNVQVRNSSVLGHGFVLDHVKLLDPVVPLPVFVVLLE